MRRQRKVERLTDPHSLDVERAIGAMTPEFVQCRDFGHPWRPHNVVWLDSEQCYRVELKCSRCGTGRHELRNRRGAKLETHYDYPEGYLVSGIGRLTGTDRDQIRLKSIMGLLDRKAETA